MMSLEEFLENSICLSEDEEDFLSDLLREEKNFIEIYKEEDLKVKFIAPILNKIHFRDEEREIREFYEEKLRCYQYFVSENYDSTKIEDLKGIYKNLPFVKEEIKGLV
ncbi:MAG: hypothetical protein H7A23_06380 [Leptospiraceae bacterium]|nr:hypothetical protein [Leptospiraceae bacterium]